MRPDDAEEFITVKFYDDEDGDKMLEVEGVWLDADEDQVTFKGSLDNIQLDTEGYAYILVDDRFLHTFTTLNDILQELDVDFHGGTLTAENITAHMLEYFEPDKFEVKTVPDKGAPPPRGVPLKIVR